MNEFKNYIFSLRKEDRSLKAIKEFMKILKNPHKKYKIIHIGGSNGKGSVVEMLYRILREKYGVGKYISPHLIRLNERIVVNDLMVDDEYIKNFIENTKDFVNEFKPHFFDFLTAMAFKYFEEKDVDWAVVEVGLGGKYDSTNIVSPEISVITEVSYEHTDKLGTSMEEIAFEKAGIVKNSPVVIGPTNTIAKNIIKRYAKHYLSADEHVGIQSYSISEEKIEVEVYGAVNGKFCINGTGTYQIKNILTALLTAKILVERGVVEWDDVKQGLQKARFPGRFEIFKNKNLKIILDSAHNPEGAREVANTYLSLYGRGGKAVVVQMRDKNHYEFFRELCRAVDSIVIPKYNYWRAEKQEKLARYASKFCENVEIVSCDVLSYIQEINDSERILITGSTYLVGDVRRWLIEGQ